MNTPLQTRQQKHSLITKPLDSLLNIPVTTSITNFRGPSNYNAGQFNPMQTRGNAPKIQAIVDPSIGMRLPKQASVGRSIPQAQMNPEEEKGQGADVKRTAKATQKKGRRVAKATLQAES